MISVGLTGGIGSGKTTVAKIFEVLGIPVYYADDAAKRLMNENTELKEKLIAAFGQETYTNEKLNRTHLASTAFASPEKTALLNSIVHPITLADAAAWMAAQKAPYAIKEAALMFESDAHKQVELIIGVTAPAPIRIQRIQLRDNLSEAEIQQRMARQMADEEKMTKCDIVIVNDDTQSIIPQVMTIHKQLLAKANS